MFGPTSICAINTAEVIKVIIIIIIIIIINDILTLRGKKPEIIKYPVSRFMREALYLTKVLPCP